MGEGDDFYELYEEFLDDDEISPEEEGFMNGFIGATKDKKIEMTQPDKPEDRELEIEIDNIELEWEINEADEGEREEGDGELEAFVEA